jgi:hypothetical protein
MDQEHQDHGDPVVEFSENDCQRTDIAVHV